MQLSRDKIVLENVEIKTNLETDRNLLVTGKMGDDG